MPGFPIRSSRAAFGPRTLKDRTTGVRDNEREIGAATFKLAWWQLAGCNVTADLCWGLLAADGTWLAGEEAWDPDGASVPQVDHPSDGVYVITYAATYEDETGTSVPLTMHAVQATQQDNVGGADMRANGSVTGNVVTVYVYDTTGALTDGDVLFSVK